MIPRQVRKKAVQVVDTYDLTATQRAVVLHQAMAYIEKEIGAYIEKGIGENFDKSLPMFKVHVEHYSNTVGFAIQSYIKDEYPEVTS